MSAMRGSKISDLRSANPVRQLNANQLGLRDAPVTPDQSIATNTVPTEDIVTDPTPTIAQLNVTDDDPRLDELYAMVRSLVDDDGYAGVIFVGPPGTSKSWYAAQVAAKLVDLDPRRLRFLQFHASYQYEDFVEGYVPTAGTFAMKDKHLLDMCRIASADFQGKPCVLVIDELSRCDPGRVFGEALTYIEKAKRGLNFRLASGTQRSIPPNLIFIATMNEQDHGVDVVDAALERRFAKIEMKPNEAALRQVLARKDLADATRNRLIGFFRYLNGHSNVACRIGHAYFEPIKDEKSLSRLWEHQLRFHLKKAFPLNAPGFDEIERRWQQVLPTGETPTPAGGSNAGEQDS